MLNHNCYQMGNMNALYATALLILFQIFLVAIIGLVSGKQKNSSRENESRHKTCSLFCHYHKSILSHTSSAVFSSCWEEYLRIQITESRINVSCFQCSKHLHPNGKGGLK